MHETHPKGDRTSWRLDQGFPPPSGYVGDVLVESELRRIREQAAGQGLEAVLKALQSTELP